MLARGGMAVVYLVHQPALDREVVLKRLDLERDEPTLAQRFVREARLAAALDHPNVVTLFDFFEHDGVPYIAMEYVAGGSLRSLVGTLELPQVLGVLEGTLAGLAHAERHGIAHRDLKPENVLVTRRGNVKIADFGIARAYNALSQRLTITGKAMGTPVYMAPEQALDRAIGPPTDLYALGVIVYELLAGRPPFEADTPMGVLYCHVHKPPPPLPAAVEPPVREWVGWLLEKSPADRPQSAAEAWQALEEIAVAELGPYWRRAAAITIPTGGHDGLPPATASSRAPTRRPGRPAPRPRRRCRCPSPRRRRPRRAGPGGGGPHFLRRPPACSALPPWGSRPRSPATTHRPRTPGPRRLRRRMTSTLTAGSSSSPPCCGRRRPAAPGAAAAWCSCAAARAGTSSPSATRACRGGRGTTTTSARRWRAATSTATAPRTSRIGAPGRDRMAVLYGTGRGLDGGRRLQLRGPDEYGYGALAADLDGDGYDDLVVTAPAAGTVEYLRGGPDGLDADRSRPIARPESAATDFGARMRAGDVDGDRRIDLVEGAPTRQSGPGHLAYCRGSRAGPRRCRTLDSSRGTSALAVADVNGDGYADIVQGDSGHAQNLAGAPVDPGQVRLWLGGRDGPRSTPIAITQNTPHIPGDDEPGDEFGAVVAAGDLDGDGKAEMVVGATRENDGAGRVTVIRGGRSGYATAGHTSFDQDSGHVPGRRAIDGEFGSAMSILNLSDDRRLDLAVAARGAHITNARVMVVEGGDGIFAPDETDTRTLSGAAARVHSPRGVRIRLARVAGG